MDKCFFRICIACLLACLPLSFLCAQDLRLSPEDLLIELRPDGGYHLFIRYKPDISSVLLTETTRDPQFNAANYAYRTAEKNPVNGDEIRLINGYPIPPESKIYSLVSSTPEEHPTLSWAYHIYIPHVLYYGYEGGRHGEVHVGVGTYLNIRAFYYAYADYRGPFRDNPFMLQASQEPPDGSEKGAFVTETAAAFTEIAKDNTVYSGGSASLVEEIGAILERQKGKDLDIVICLDTTSSMKPHIDAVRKELITTLQEMISEANTFRMGMVLFKDYRDEYLNRVIPFTPDFEKIQRDLNAIRVTGGGDIPEAVYEALYAGATKFTWEAESRVMILVGDAPPHSRPRGKITKKMADDEIAKQNIAVHAIILPKISE